MSGTRDNTFRKFGPLLLEAVILVLLEQINSLRENQGMPLLEAQNLINSLNNHINDLQPYDWMQEGIP